MNLKLNKIDRTKTCASIRNESKRDYLIQSRPKNRLQNVSLAKATNRFPPWFCRVYLATCGRHNLDATYLTRTPLFGL